MVCVCYLYPPEAVRAGFAVVIYPFVTQTRLQRGPQGVTAVSALQEAPPLPAAVGVVIPKSLHPL